MSIIVSHTILHTHNTAKRKIDKGGGDRKNERERSKDVENTLFNTQTTTNFNYGLFIVVVIALLPNGLPNRNIRHLNVFCLLIRQVCLCMSVCVCALKAELSNETQSEREVAEVFCSCLVFFSVLLYSVVYFRLLYSSSMAIVVVVMMVMLLCKIRYLNEMLIPLPE